MERLASEAKVEALEASRRLHQLETDNAVAQSKVHERFNEKLIEMASSRQVLYKPRRLNRCCLKLCLKTIFEIYILPPTQS